MIEISLDWWNLIIEQNTQGRPDLLFVLMDAKMGNKSVI